MRRINFIVPCAALLLAMTGLPGVASAQVLYGSLTGNVTRSQRRGGSRRESGSFQRWHRSQPAGQHR